MSPDQRPRVSVVVTARDAETTVGGTLASIARQLRDAPDVEVVVVDDGSCDATAAVVAEAAGSIPGLQVLRNAAPLGRATARNQGIAASTGRYLAFLDTPDRLAAGHLATVADAMDRLGCDFVRVDHTVLAAHSRRLVRAPHARRGVVIDPRSVILPAGETTMVDDVAPFAGLYHRRLATEGLLHFADGLGASAELPWTWRLHLRARTFAVVDAPGVRRVAPEPHRPESAEAVRALHRTLDVVLADREAARFLPKVADVVAHRARAVLDEAARSGSTDEKAARRALGDLRAVLPPGAWDGPERRRRARAPRRRTTTQTLTASSWVTA